MMKVCKLVRLTSKNEKGLFVKGEKAAHVVLRNKCVVSQETVNNSEKNYEKTGLLYVVDEKKTAERDSKIELEKAGNIEVTSENVSEKAEKEKAEKEKTGNAPDKL